MIREHDLPPRWDGHAVEWAGWEDRGPTTLVFHLPVESHACPSCGSLAAQRGERANVGRVLPREGTTALHTGHRRLFATRCADCGHDQVYDLERDALYDLDDTDYGPEGSVEPEPEPEALQVPVAAAARPQRAAPPAAESIRRAREAARAARDAKTEDGALF